MSGYHGIVLGECGSGKSYLCANILAKGFRAAGVGVLAHIPGGTPPWVFSDRCLYDAAAFIELAMRARRCAIFIEMSDAGVSKYDGDFCRLATFSRHLGHRCFFIAQRHTQISPVIRDQCAMLWLFRVGWKTAEVLAEEYVDEALRGAPGLPDRAHFFKERGRPAVRVG
jgi:hypothetical protein